jgi:hypothetical protein
MMAALADIVLDPKAPARTRIAAARAILAADALNQTEEKLAAGPERLDVRLSGTGPAGEIVSQTTHEPPVDAADRTAEVLRILINCGAIRTPGPADPEAAGGFSAAVPSVPPPNGKG